jgi:hypothetical protein
MARFFVGQRVRIVGHGASDDTLSFIERMDWLLLRGEEGRIVSLDGTGGGCFPGYQVFAVGGIWILPPCGLEPIIPEGDQPAELTVEELLPFLKAREFVA